MTDPAQRAESVKIIIEAEKENCLRYANISITLLDQKSPVHQEAGYPRKERHSQGHCISLSILFYSIFSIIHSQHKVKTLGTRFLGSSHYISTEKVQCNRFCLTKHLLKLSIFCCHGTQLTHLVPLQVL